MAHFITNNFAVADVNVISYICDGKIDIKYYP